MTRYHSTREERFNITMKHLYLVLCAQFPFASQCLKAQLPKHLMRDVGLRESNSDRDWWNLI